MNTNHTSANSPKMLSEALDRLISDEAIADARASLPPAARKRIEEEFAERPVRRIVRIITRKRP